MPLMHWCTARVNLSGQGFHIVHYESTAPISWPEAQVLMLLHGEENVMDVKPIYTSDIQPGDEKRRLQAKYDPKAVEQIFPGRTFHMELTMPAEATDQPLVDSDGARIAVMPDDDDDPPAGDPPPGAVFKPGKHRPAAGG